MTTTQTQCKFCRKPITLELDEEGLSFCREMGIHLMGMAACNRCADLRTTKYKITDRLVRACTIYAQKKSKKSEDNMSEREKKLREVCYARFTALLLEYSELIRDWTGKESWYDSSVPAQLMETPNEVYSILQHMWPERRTA